MKKQGCGKESLQSRSNDYINLSRAYPLSAWQGHLTWALVIGFAWMNLCHLAARAPPAIPLPSRYPPATILPTPHMLVNDVKTIHTLQICAMRTRVKVSNITKSLRLDSLRPILNTFTNAWLNRNANSGLLPVVFSKECTTVVDKFFRASYSSLNCSAESSNRGR